MAISLLSLYAIISQYAHKSVMLSFPWSNSSYKKIHNCGTHTFSEGEKYYRLLLQIESRMLKPMLLAMENCYFDSN